MTGSAMFLCLGLRYREHIREWCTSPASSDSQMVFCRWHIIGGLYWRLLAIVSDSGNPGSHCQIDSTFTYADTVAYFHEISLICVQVFRIHIGQLFGQLHWFK